MDLPLANGVNTHYDYDPAGRLQQLLAGPDTDPVLKQAYTYDKVGNITKINDEIGRAHV